MLEISGKTNLLEQNAYKYSLQDVAEPNLQRDIYTQGAVPKVPFNHRRVPMNMPEEIWITDTSLRDGQQSVEPYTVDQIVNIYKYLSRLGGPYGIIRQTEFFIYSKKDREALEKCMELGLKFPEITTWIRATKEDFRLVRDLGIRETGILVSCSDYHIFKKMKMTRRQAMDYYLATVADAFEAGVVPRCHLEDITRAGIHADGLLKDAEIYTIFDTEKLLNRPASVQVAKTSGLAGIAYWINQNYRLTGERQIDKHDPLVLALKGWVDAEYEDGRQTVLSAKELNAKIAELAPGRFAQV